MARHSHWHNIQLTKGKADARRAKSFAKLAKSLTAAAKESGGDPSFNVSLRMAMDAARAVNMPKDNIDRAIARGTGEGAGGEAIEEVVYEAFGPGGSALLIQCLTDNGNRSVTEVRTTLSKNRGTMVTQGSVSWLFEKKGVIVLTQPSTRDAFEAFELSAIEAGAEEVFEEEGFVELLTSVSALKAVLAAVDTHRLSLEKAAIEFVAKETMVLNQQDQESLTLLIEKIEALDDVDTVFTNV